MAEKSYLQEYELSWFFITDIDVIVLNNPPFADHNSVASYKGDVAWVGHSCWSNCDLEMTQMWCVNLVM